MSEPKSDKKGFIVNGPHESRTFVAIRSAELKALERSMNPSLRALAKRVRQAIAEKEEWWEVRRRRSEALREMARKHQQEIDADPIRKAEQERQREEFNRLIAPAANRFLGVINGRRGEP